MKCVCNTGPLIALAKVDALRLLSDLTFDEIVIPTRVHKDWFSDALVAQVQRLAEES